VSGARAGSPPGYFKQKLTVADLDDYTSIADGVHRVEDGDTASLPAGIEAGCKGILCQYSSKLDGGKRTIIQVLDLSNPSAGVSYHFKRIFTLLYGVYWTNHGWVSELSGFSTLSLSSAWTSSSRLKYRMIDGRVHLSGLLEQSATPGTAVGTLPAGFLPGNLIYVPGVFWDRSGADATGDDTYSASMLTVQSNGLIHVKCVPVTDDTYYFRGSFKVGE
jgi:hypothetical protein